MNSVQINSKIKISASLVIQMLRYASSLEIDISYILEKFHIGNNITDFSDEKIPLEKYLKIEEELVRVTGDIYFGLHMGEYVEPGSWSILGYIMMNCDSIEESILKLQRYSSVVGNLFKIDIKNRNDITEIDLLTATGKSVMSRHCAEAALSSLICIIHCLADEKIFPVQAELAFEQPEKVDEYQRIFQCPVHFNTKETKIFFLYKDLRKKINHSNQSLLNYFEKYAEDALNSLESSSKLIKEVTELVLKKLEEDLSIHSIAEEMGISGRTLQLRLKKEGKNFINIVKEARESLSKKYLADNYPVDEISYLIGFSEPSIFRRAFKKWTGLTPREFKRKNT